MAPQSSVFAGQLPSQIKSGSAGLSRFTVSNLWEELISSLIISLVRIQK